MNPFQKAMRWIGERLTGKQKFLDYPTITGGFDIFRGMFWDDNWSQGKQLATYKKSLYVFACVSKIAKKTASIDWTLMKLKNKVGDTQEIFIHESLDLLYRPNPFQTKTEFFEKYMINKLLAGETFVLKVRNPQGKVVELWNLRPDYMRTLIDNKDPRLIKGYEFNGKHIFDPNDIIHDAYPSPLDEFGGMSALQSASTRIDTEEFASKYQANFFKNNARPDFIVMTEDKIDASQKEEIKSGWDKRHKGSENAGKGAFLEGGLKYQQVSISQREMDYIESMKATRDDILVAFGVPKPIVAITDDVNLANAETGMQIFLSETIVPEINRLTEKLNEHLIYPEYGDIYFIEYEDPVPTNEKSDAETDEILLRSGVMLINEAREKRGMTPIAGGNSLYMPIGMVPVGGLPTTGSPKARTRSFETKRRAKALRGRPRAVKFLEEKAKAKAIIYKALAKEIKTELKTGYVKGIIPAEIRDNYSDVVNKAIDEKGKAFKPKLLDYGEDQMKRVLSELNKRENSLDVKALDGMFDKTKENKILTNLSIPFIQEFLESAGKDAMQTVAPANEFEITERVQKFIVARAKEMAKSVNDTTIEKLSRTLAEGIEAGEGIAKLTARVETVYSEYPTYRAEMIARTEATAANNKGFTEAYQQSGVANAKEWIATRDSRTREEHLDLDGEIVGLDDDFSNGLPYPQEPNCRCVIGPAFKE